MKNIQGLTRKALEKWNMIDENDKIAVGVSGGKDSLTLLETLTKLSNYYPKKFSVVAITIDMFDGKTDFSKVSEFCKSLGVEHHIVNTKLYELLFEVRKEKNPCSLCSKIRRGALCAKANELGCNKVALGHHADDLVETFFLSLFYEGRLSTFSPKTFLTKTNVTVIRPMLLVWEKSIISHAKTLPIVQNACPADKHTNREWVKTLLHELGFKLPKLSGNLLSAITSPERYHLFDKFNESE